MIIDTDATVKNKLKKKKKVDTVSGCSISRNLKPCSDRLS